MLSGYHVPRGVSTVCTIKCREMRWGGGGGDRCGTRGLKAFNNKDTNANPTESSLNIQNMIFKCNADLTQRREGKEERDNSMWFSFVFIE